MKLALCAFTAAGAALARYIAQLPGYSCTLRPRDMPLDEFVATWMPECEGLVFVGAAGIAVRAIAPHLRRKDRDPAVLVLDEKGQFVIPILSGHLGGANALATKLARQLGATPVLTTATDLNGVFAVDLWSQKAGCVIGEIDRIRAVSGTLLRGQTVGLYSDFEVRGQLPPGLETGTGSQVGLCISLDGKRQPFTTTLHLYPRIVTVGVGCKKGTDAQALERFFLQSLQLAGVSPLAVRGLASIDLKREEPAICALAQKYSLPFWTYSAAQLQAVPGRFAVSDFVLRTTGTDNVCERSAVAAGGELILSKQVCDGMTLALAAADWSCSF